jgi:hypothetical protein
MIVDKSKEEYRDYPDALNWLVILESTPDGGFLAYDPEELKHLAMTQSPDALERMGLSRFPDILERIKGPEAAHITARKPAWLH